MNGFARKVDWTNPSGLGPHTFSLGCLLPTTRWNVLRENVT